MPHFANEDGTFKALVQAFVICTDEKKILAYACISNGKQRKYIPAWIDLQTNFLDKLEQQGCKSEYIKIVLCTHLHFGLNTKLVNGMWVSTFPNALYLFAEYEYNYWLNKQKNSR